MDFILSLSSPVKKVELNERNRRNKAVMSKKFFMDLLFEVAVPYISEFTFLSNFSLRSKA